MKRIELFVFLAFMSLAMFVSCTRKSIGTVSGPTPTPSAIASAKPTAKPTSAPTAIAHPTAHPTATPAPATPVPMQQQSAYWISTDPYTVTAVASSDATIAQAQIADAHTFIVTPKTAGTAYIDVTMGTRKFEFAIMIQR